MATIKRAGNRIITKVVNGQRRVSCSCCPSEGCCMYPAQALTDGLYTVADLPDELEMYYSDGTNFDGPTIVLHNGDGTYGELGEDGGANPAYIFKNTLGDEWITTYFQLDGAEVCLVKALEADDPPSLSKINVWVFDRFADCYAITFPANYQGVGEPELTIIAQRDSLCQWQFLDLDSGSGILEYSPETFRMEINAEFELDGFNYLYNEFKIGNQNKPDGSYLGGVTVAETTCS
jgi:hypothetical protein